MSVINKSEHQYRIPIYDCYMISPSLLKKYMYQDMDDMYPKIL